MKKYLIVNDDGTKKTIYAKDLMQALKLSDAINIIPGMFISLKVGSQQCVYRVKEINHGEYGVVLVRYIINEDGQLVERGIDGNYSFASLKKNVNNIFNTYDEAKKYLLHHNTVRTAYITGLKSLRKKNDSVDTVDKAYNPEYSIQQFKSYVSNIMKDLYGNEYNREKVRAISKLDACVSQVIDDFKADTKNSNLDKRKTVQYYTQYVDALYEEITNVKNVQNIDGQSLKKIDDIHAKMARSIHDSELKDEASLATTINALVNDEKAAIDAYDVAIKNLEGKIDEDAKQVLINIRDDERRHIENLYAILNGQVTEKNLEDSIKDAAPGVDKKKFDRLVNYFNAWGKPSRNELQEVIDYYKLNSATAYQLLYYWGYKNEFEKLHFYDSYIRDAYEVLWYTDEKLNNYETKEFKSRSAAMDFYNAHKNDKDKFAWWVTRRNSDWAVVEDIVY